MASKDSGLLASYVVNPGSQMAESDYTKHVPAIRVIPSSGRRYWFSRGVMFARPCDTRRKWQKYSVFRGAWVSSLYMDRVLLGECGGLGENL